MDPVSETENEAVPVKESGNSEGRDAKGRLLPGRLPVVGRPFPKGKSGNPNGRPYNLKTALEKALQRVVDETGKEPRMVADMVANRIIEIARGDMGATKDQDVVGAFKAIAGVTVPKETEQNITLRREPGVIVHRESAHEVRKREREEKGVQEKDKA